LSCSDENGGSALYRQFDFVAELVFKTDSIAPECLQQAPSTRRMHQPLLSDDSEAAASSAAHADGMSLQEHGAAAAPAMRRSRSMRDLLEPDHPGGSPRIFKACMPMSAHRRCTSIQLASTAALTPYFYRYVIAVVFSVVLVAVFVACACPRTISFYNRFLQPSTLTSSTQREHSLQRCFRVLQSRRQHRARCELWNIFHAQVRGAPPFPPTHPPLRSSRHCLPILSHSVDYLSSPFLRGDTPSTSCCSCATACTFLWFFSQ
jgi:hypothetical protein